jgi:hypothetical protein
VYTGPRGDVDATHGFVQVRREGVGGMSLAAQHGEQAHEGGHRRHRLPVRRVVQTHHHRLRDAVGDLQARAPQHAEGEATLPRLSEAVEWKRSEEAPW